MNYDEILSRCLGKVPNDIDTREGSFIYTALAPLCYELAQAYFELENMLELTFLDTAYGEYLDKTIAIIGISRNSATKCQKTAEIITENDIIGEKFSCDQYIFEVLEKISDNTFIIEASDFGIEYNSILGDLTSIMNLSDIESATISENYILASDEESDENLRERAISHILTKSFGGNIPDYEEKILEISGVAYVKIFTANDVGLGRVHIVVAGTDKTQLSEQIVQNCTDVFIGTDENEGIAPIGHDVTFSTVEYVSLDISCKIIVEDGANQELIVENAKIQLENYFAYLAFTNPIVSRMKMISYLLQIEEILDVEEFLINGEPENFVLSKEYTSFQTAIINSSVVEISE